MPYADPDKAREKARARYRLNREKILQQKRDGYAELSAEERRARRDAQRENKAAWRADNLDRVRAKDREHARARRERNKDNPQFRLSITLRTRLNGALAGNFKTGSAVRDLGCTIPELRAYLQAQFAPGMSWDNWGHVGDVWHIDHIKPLASFDLANREQFLAACHYTNLQPLWAKDNLRKGANLW